MLFARILQALNLHTWHKVNRFSKLIRHLACQTADHCMNICIHKSIESVRILFKMIFIFISFFVRFCCFFFCLLLFAKKPTSSAESAYCLHYLILVAKEEFHTTLLAAHIFARIAEQLMNWLSAIIHRFDSICSTYVSVILFVGLFVFARFVVAIPYILFKYSQRVDIFAPNWNCESCDARLCANEKEKARRKERIELTPCFYVYTSFQSYTFYQIVRLAIGCRAKR